MSPRGWRGPGACWPRADALYRQGDRDKRLSERYTQAAVFLAISMFFGGIGQVFKLRGVRLVLLAVAIVGCAAGLARILTLPAMRPL